MRRRAFTMAELIVVMAVIVLLITVAVPSISAMMESNRRAEAEQTLRAGLTSGRLAALRSAAGEDGAVVFLASDTGRISLVACERVGRLPDWTPSDLNGGEPVWRDVFVPVSGLDPVQLPPGWSVRAQVRAGVAGAGNTDTNLGWYDGVHYVDNERNWVYPETSFYDASDDASGVDRQSFIVRFDGGAGALSSDVTDALVYVPSTSSTLRGRSPFNSYRIEQAEDPASVIRRLLADDRMGDFSSGYVSEMTDLLGDVSPDTILTRPVRVMVLYKDRDLANALGVQADRETGTLYADPYADPSAGPTLVSASLDLEDITRWLEGNTDLDDNYILARDGSGLDTDGSPDGDRPDDAPRSRVFTIEASSGRVVELPLVPLDASEGSLQ